MEDCLGALILNIDNGLVINKRIYNYFLSTDFYKLRKKEFEELGELGVNVMYYGNKALIFYRDFNMEFLTIDTRAMNGVLFEHIRNGTVSTKYKILK